MIPALFVDPLDIWLMLLGTTLLATTYWVYVNFVSGKSEEDKRAISRGFGFFNLFLGAYAFITGLWGTATWPLPGPYNIVIIDEWAIFGVALLLLGASQTFNLNFIGTSYGLAALGFPTLIHGLVILSKGLTREPQLASLMYILIGLAAILSPLLGYYSANGRGKAAAYIIIIILVIAALIALYIGVEAAFGHTDRWSGWAPWYGRSGT